MREISWGIFFRPFQVNYSLFHLADKHELVSYLYSYGLRTPHFVLLPPFSDVLPDDALGEEVLLPLSWLSSYPEDNVPHKVYFFLLEDSVSSFHFITKGTFSREF